MSAAETESSEGMAGFKICQGRYFIGFWYFDIPTSHPGFGVIGPFGKGGNYNLLVWREGSDDGGGEKVAWTVQWRFRYYRDGRVHDHEDRMEWYSAKVTASTREEMEESTSKLVKQMAAMVDEIYDFFPIFGDCLEWARRVTTKAPYWMQLTPETIAGLAELVHLHAAEKGEA